MERIKEFSELPREPPEFVEPRPPASWPASGEIKCENLVIRYAVSVPLPISQRSHSSILHTQPALPNVLHNLNFTIAPG